MKPKKEIPLWAIILARFKSNGWVLTINDFPDRRGWRSFSQTLSKLKKRGVYTVLDKIESDGEMISRWTIPEKVRPLAIAMLESKDAQKPIPYANLEPPPPPSALFETEHPELEEGYQSRMRKKVSKNV